MSLSRITALAGSAALVVLAALPADARSAVAARARPAALVHLVLGLKLRDEAGLAALVAAQADSASPLFRHFLTPVQLRDAFGVPAAAYARLGATLRSRGFALEPADDLRMSLGVRAPASTIERYFATRLLQAGGAPYAIDSPALPRELRPAVAAVAGLERSAFHAAPRLGGERSAVANFAALPYGPDGGYGPQAVAAAFDFPVRHGYDGRGVTVADIWDGDFNDDYDLEPYLHQFGIKRSGPKTRIAAVDGGCATVGCADSFSAASDAEGIVGTAPGAILVLYEIPSLAYPAVLDGLHAIVKDGRADVVNLSFAACETGAGESALLFDREFQLGSAEGMTFEVGTYGGSHPCAVAGPTVQAPADSPHILAFSGADTFVGPSGKTTRPPIGNVDSGGGYSKLFTLPAFQKGVTGMLAAGRNVPDLAGPAAIDAVGASAYYSGAGGWLGGLTFVNNAPLAGALAEAVQMKRGRLGALDPAMYALAKNGSRTPLFADVTLGCNGPYDSGPYCAAPGYDRISGFGVPDMFAIAGWL